MISPSAVQSSADHFQQGLDAYQSEVQGLTGFWEGNSYNQFQSHAEAFISEYSSITSQMNHFAQACAKYFEYMSEKANYEAAMAAAEDNANKAASGARNANELSSYARSQAEDAERYKANMERLKAEILSLLSSVSSVQLHAESISNLAPSSAMLASSVSGAPTQVAMDALSWAKMIADDNRYGYVSGGMGASQGGYDCTQFVHAAYKAAGIDLPDHDYVNQANIADYYTGQNITGNMSQNHNWKNLANKGFIWVPGPVDPSVLQPGDIVVNTRKHAEIYYGNGQLIGAHSNKDGRAGDSGGNEISVGNFYNNNWDGYLRYVGQNAVGGVTNV